MKQEETNFADKVRPFLRMIGAFHEKTSDKYQVGVSDLRVCLRGLSIMLENKKSKRAPFTAIQCRRLIEHASAGGLGCFVFPENWDEVRDLLMKISMGDHQAVEDLASYGSNQVKARLDYKLKYYEKLGKGVKKE